MSAYPIMFDCAGYTLFDKTGRAFRDGDKIAVAYETARHGTLHRFYRLGSVYGYAVENGDDVEATVNRARERGHDLFWANQCATVITSQQRAKENAALVKHGDVIKAFGKFFQIDPAPNGNVHLVEVSNYTEADWIAATVAHVAERKAA